MSAPESPREERRLAVVLNGGVSLAVWIGHPRPGRRVLTEAGDGDRRLSPTGRRLAQRLWRAAHPQDAP